MFVFKSSDRIFGASNLQFLFNVCVIFDKTIKNTILSTKWGCLSPTHSFFLFFGSVVLFPFTAHADPQQGVHSASRFYSLWGRLHSVIYKSTRNYTSASQPFLEFQTYWTSGLFGNGRCNFFKNSSTLKIPLLFFFFDSYFLLSLPFSILPGKSRRMETAPAPRLQGKVCLGMSARQCYREYTFSVANTYSSTCIYKYANTDISLCAFHGGVELDLQRRKWSRNGILIRIVVEDTCQPCKKRWYDVWIYFLWSCTIRVKCYIRPILSRLGSIIFDMTIAVWISYDNCGLNFIFFKLVSFYKKIFKTSFFPKSVLFKKLNATTCLMWSKPWKIRVKASLRSNKIPAKWPFYVCKIKWFILF